MVWPFSTSSTSPSSTFEKRLSALSTRITAVSSRLSRLRFQARKWKAIVTLYTSFAYTLYAALLFFLTDWHQWHPLQYAALILGPVLVISVRMLLNAFFEYRIGGTQKELERLQAEKRDAIERFKDETKFNSTQLLLEKYGAAGEEAPPPPPPRAPDAKKEHQRRQSTHLPQRTGLPPPPTANIQRPSTSHGSTPPPPTVPPPNPSSGLHAPPNNTPALPQLHPPPSPTFGEEFAPNADSPTSPQYLDAAPRWYDRLLDVILGDDETKPLNRLALICQHCKLVNGQAPPGVKALEEVGRWRCAECKGANGEEPAADSEVRLLMREAAADADGEGVRRRVAASRSDDA